MGFFAALLQFLLCMCHCGLIESISSCLEFERGHLSFMLTVQGVRNRVLLKWPTMQ